MCLRTAADAGVAPAVHVADPDAGIVVMDFIDQRPITEYPGGPVGVLRELGGRLAGLQATATFPPLLDDFAALLGQMLAMIESAGVFAPGVLAPVHDGFDRIRAAYPWERDVQVSSHNDVNPFNVLFDGERLWLIDWEIAFRNDPLADVACVANNFVDPIAHAGSAGALEDDAAPRLARACAGRSDAQPPGAHAATEPALLCMPDDEHVHRTASSPRSTSTRPRSTRSAPRWSRDGSRSVRPACCTPWARCSSPDSSPA